MKFRLYWIDKFFSNSEKFKLSLLYRVTVERTLQLLLNLGTSLSCKKGQTCKPSLTCLWIACNPTCLVNNETSLASDSSTFSWTLLWLACNYCALFYLLTSRLHSSVNWFCVFVIFSEMFLRKDTIKTVWKKPAYYSHICMTAVWWFR